MNYPAGIQTREECEALLSALMMYGPCMLIAIDEHYCIRSINRVIDGLRIEDVLGTSTLDYIPQENRKAVRSVIDEVFRTGTPNYFETRGPVADGALGWWATHVLPIARPESSIRAILLTTEVTAERRAEEALRVSESRYRALVKVSADVIYRMGPDWTELRQLDGRNFIADSNEPNRVWLEQYIPLPDRAEVLVAIDHAIRECKPFELEHRVQRADGSIGWMRSRAVPMVDAHGMITEWVGTATDITAHREAQQSLKDSEERLRHAMDAAGEGTWDWDLAAGKCHLSPSNLMLLGYENHPGIIDVSWVQTLMHPDDVDAISRSIESLKQSGQVTMRFRLRRAGGGIIDGSKVVARPFNVMPKVIPCELLALMSMSQNGCNLKKHCVAANHC